IIMTSNIGSELIRSNFELMDEDNKEEIIDKTRNLVYDLLKQSVRPEFLNRIDEVIMFRPLSREDIRGIVEIQLKQLKAKLLEQDIHLTVTPHAMDWLTEEGYSPEFGARPLKRVIQQRVLKQLSKQMLRNEVVPGSRIVLDVFDDIVVFRQAIKEEELVD
ncbi:MAG: ATP-dependent Clp protease ATP-binding subunit, partial [Bacteroidetes bacterium]